MLDFNHILTTPGYDFQQFNATSTVTLRQWKTWQKPRGVKWVYIIGVGGGGGGSTGGRGGSVTGAGGGGGSSGGQSNLLIPASCIPDVLYIQCGIGGAGSTTTGATGVAGNNGLPTYVAIEPGTQTPQNTALLFANGGGGGGAEVTTGSPGGTAAAATIIVNMSLAGRGIYTLLDGHTGGIGAQRIGGTNPLAFPTGGTIVMGGAGGGAGGSTPSAGSAITAPTGALGTDFFPGIAGGTVAVTSTPATSGVNGIIARNYLMNYGGTGGGGSSATGGGVAGNGGNGAPGCGGGGAGGINSVNTTAVTSGAGGDGFVYIISW